MPPHITSMAAVRPSQPWNTFRAVSTATTTTTTAEMRMRTQVCSSNMEKAAPVLRTKVRSSRWGMKGMDWPRSMPVRTRYFTTWSATSSTRAMIV